MPWECRTVENQRREFAQAAEYCSNFSALCREFGITRHTGNAMPRSSPSQTEAGDRIPVHPKHRKK